MKLNPREEMTISEMIEHLAEKLREYGDIRVLVDGYEAGYDNPAYYKEEVTIFFENGSHYYGKYDTPYNYDEHGIEQTPNKDVFKALIISRI